MNQATIYAAFVILLVHFQGIHARTLLPSSNGIRLRQTQVTPLVKVTDKLVSAPHLDVIGLPSNPFNELLPLMVYRGGPLIKSPVVSTLAWGSGGNLEVVRTFPAANSFLADLPKTTYAEWINKEYSTKKQVLRGGRLYRELWLIIDFNATVTNKAIQGAIKQLINQKVLLNNVDGNAMTMIFLPPGVSVLFPTDSKCKRDCIFLTSCLDVCSYHSFFKFNGKNQYYAVIPDLDCANIKNAMDCKQGLPLLDATTNAISREYFSMKTNPDGGFGATNQEATNPDGSFVTTGLGWVDDKYQIGLQDITDPCPNETDRIKGPSGITWTVQQIWSNKYNACLTSPTRPHLINGTFANS